MLTDREVLSTINMLRSEHLDVRTVTMGINLFDCASSDFDTFAYKVRSKIFRYAEKLVETCDLVGDRYGIPVVNKRISVSPIGTVGASFSRDEMVAACRVLDESAKEVGVDFIGGFGALVEKGMTPGEKNLIDALPEALAVTDRICSSINVGSTKAGINMNAVRRMGDFVLTSCAANALQPYRQNDNGWDQGQVFFTPSQVWGMPPYYAQQMAAAHHRPLTVGCGVEGADGVLDVTATRSREAGSVVLHIANTGAEPLRVGLRVDGMGKVSQARMVSLSGDLDAVNTPEEPRRIAPVGRELPAWAAQTVDIAPYSYTIVVLDE